jgi:hypothetical protein
LVVLLLAFVGAAAFVVPGSAWATTGHSFVGQFGEKGAGDGQFGSPLDNGPVGLAVMSSTGEVFTVDHGSGTSGNPVRRVQRFSADGVFASKFPIDLRYTELGGIAVDARGSGAVYLAVGRNDGGDVGRVVKYSTTGDLAYELDASGLGASAGVSINPFNSSPGLAVDPVDGTVYVSATGPPGPGVASYDGDTGAYIGFFDGSTTPEGFFGTLDPFCFEGVKGLAVDSLQRVYALDPCKNRVDRFAGGVYDNVSLDPQLPSPETLSEVAVDPVSDEVYVSHTGPVGMQVTHFSAGGAAPLYTFDALEVDGVRALAVSGVGTVYTSDAAGPVVERFTRFEGPTVVTGDAPEETVEARSAVLEGTIDPEGVDSKYHFEYGLDQRYGSRTVGFVGVGSGSDPVAASAAITGLKPNTTYHFRIVGSNDSGSIAGADGTFTTDPAAADIGPSSFGSAIGPRSARLHGAVNPNSTALLDDFGLYAQYYFEYGTTAAYGSTTTAGGGRLCGPTCGGDYMPVAAPLSGLLPGTTYHFRLVGNNGLGGEQFGADQTFTTAPAAGGGARDVTTRRAELTGTIDPHGQDTTYRFNYGPTSAYGATTSEVDAGAGNGEQLVAQAISGLSPDTTYHVQVVATSDDGVKRYGADGLFRTDPAPTAVAFSPIGVSTGAATLIGDLDTHGQAGTYRFDVTSLDSSYESSTIERAVAGNDGVERVSVPVDGLPVGEMFVVALRVRSNDSTQVSDLVTFATASLPPRVFPPPPAGDGASSYGCRAPRLDSYDAKPKPGDTIAIKGRGLGSGGSVMLGDRSLVPADWSANGFELEIPEDAAGTLGLTVDCGERSNTVAIAIFKRPSSRFSIANTTVNGSRATLSVKVPGPGKLTSSAAKAKPGKVTIRKARGAKLVVRLNRAGMRALRKSRTGRLKVPVRVRYLPAGGKPAVKTVTVTFNRTAGR